MRRQPLSQPGQERQSSETERHAAAHAGHVAGDPHGQACRAAQSRHARHDNQHGEPVDAVGQYAEKGGQASSRPSLRRGGPSCSAQIPGDDHVAAHRSRQDQIEKHADEIVTRSNRANVRPGRAYGQNLPAHALTPCVSKNNPRASNQYVTSSCANAVATCRQSMRQTSKPTRIKLPIHRSAFSRHLHLQINGCEPVCRNERVAPPPCPAAVRYQARLVQSGNTTVRSMKSPGLTSHGTGRPFLRRCAVPLVC